MENLANWVLDIENTHKKLIGFLKYMLRTGGGLVWSLLYGITLYIAWGSLSVSTKLLLVVLGLILTGISLYTPLAIKKNFDNRRKEFDNIMSLFYELNDDVTTNNGSITRAKWSSFFEALKQFHANLNPWIK